MFDFDPEIARNTLGDETLVVHRDIARDVIAMTFGRSVLADKWPRVGRTNVYLARSGLQLKVGHSSNPIRRMGDLGYEPQGSPHRLLLIIYGSAVQDEFALHRLLHVESVAREYFRGPSAEMLIASLASIATPARLVFGEAA